jgi:uncharacterized membrane protein
MKGLEVASDVANAGTPLAGLILIYIGTLVTAYTSYDATERKSVREKFLHRAYMALVGLLLALLAAALAIVGKWLGSECAADVSVWFLMAAFVWAVLTTVATIREIG